MYVSLQEVLDSVILQMSLFLHHICSYITLAHTLILVHTSYPQEVLELALLNVFVEALFDIEAKDFPGETSLLFGCDVDLVDCVPVCFRV